jgi:O-antigen ligase
MTAEVGRAVGGEEAGGATLPDMTEASERPSVVALVGWIAFVGMLVYIIFIGGGYSGILLGTLRFASLVFVAMGLGVWALLAWRKPQWRPRTAIWPALALPFAALLLTSLTSANPRLGLEYVAWAILLVALYLLLARILALPMARARIGGVAALLGFVVGIAYLAVAISGWLEWWGLLGRLTAPMLRPAYAGLPFGGPTVVTSVVILLTASAFAGLGFDTRARRVGLGALSLLTLSVVVLTGSRAGWLGLAVALGLVLLGLLFVYRDRLGPITRDRRVRIGAVVLIGAAIPVVLLFAPSLMSRLSAAGDGGRGMYFATAARMFESSPLVGVGPGNWTAQRISFMEAGEPDVYVAHSHNIYLQTLAEMGLVGALAGLVALAAVLWLVVGALRGIDAERRRWAVATTFVLIYFAVFSLVDSYVNLPLAFLLIGIPVALLDATARSSIAFPPLPLGEGSAQRTRALATAFVFVAGIGAVLVLARVESIAATNVTVVSAVREGDWETAAAGANRVAASDPDMTPYRVTQGIAAAATGDWETAERAFEAAAATDDLPQTWMNVALARMEMGRPDATVLEAIEAARRIGSQHPMVTFASGYLYDRLGLTDEADAAYVALIAGNPSIAADSRWTDELVTVDRYSTIVEGAIARSGVAWEVALMAGDAERARALARGTTDPWLAGTFVDAWMGDPVATAALQDAAIARPGDRGLGGYAARASASAGDKEMTKRLRRIATFGSEAVGTPGFESRILSADRDAVDGALQMGHLYGPNDYRRAAPGELLAPGLPSIVLVDLSVAS